MDHPSIRPFVKKYRNKSGVLDLGRFLRDADILDIKTDCFSHSGKKLTKLALPDGMNFYIKPTSYKGASAERVVSEIYQKASIIAPDTTIATLDDYYYSITNDVLPTKSTEAGEKFLEQITPGGAQYALPSVFGEGEIDLRTLSYFEPEVLEQIAEHYGLALATRNWDANIGGLGFTLQGNKEHAARLITLDFEQSLGKACRAGYANPFCPRRLSEARIINYFRNSDKPFIKKKAISQKIIRGFGQIDEIVRESKEDGFKPSQEYVDELKYSMHNMAEILER